jgi:hypothetical protein
MLSTFGYYCHAFHIWKVRELGNYPISATVSLWKALHGNSTDYGLSQRWDDPPTHAAMRFVPFVAQQR